ncbi:MAG: hypothetical protein ACXU9K_08555, partial [Thermodesulfobacteriota bacterium]
QASSIERITWRDKETPLFLSKRNLHSLEYSMFIRGGSACPFLGQPRGGNATLLPVIVVGTVRINIADFNL